MQNKTIILFFGIFLIMGIGITIIGTQMIQKTLDSQNWPKTEGIIRSSEIESHISHSHGYTTTYSPKVVYGYQVNGQNYSDDTISYSIGESSDMSYAQSFLNKYPVGKTVPVYYNPQNPAEAVLEQKMDLIGYLPLIIGIIFATVGACGIIYFVRYY